MKESGNDDSITATLLSLQRAAVRWLWSVLYVVGTVALALVLADRLQVLIDPAIAKESLNLPAIFGLSARRVAIAGLSLGLMLSSLSGLWSALVPLYRYASKAADFDFMKNVMSIFAPCFLLMFAYHSVQRSPDPEPEPAMPSAWSVRYIAPYRPTTERHAVFPFFFEPGRLDGDTITSGYALSQAQTSAIDDLITAFVPCGTSRSPVQLVVLGYASTKAFAGYESPEYGQLNRRLNTDLANLRARSIYNYASGKIADLASESSFDIRLIEHRSYDDMMKSRAFDDRPITGESESSSELFTRSAHIRIESAGRCEYSEAEIDVGESPVAPRDPA